jgi:release factor glutamine methyltransferase
MLSSFDSAPELEAGIERRVAGAPLEHVLGWAELCGVRVALQPGVFVPRPRTEMLVSEAASLAMPGTVVADMCCGSGAVGLTLSTLVEGIVLHAVDLDPGAVSCARVNLEPVGASVHSGDLYEALPAGLRGGIDLIVANAPYVPSEEFEFLPRDARDHEPRSALDGGSDGLDLHRRLAGSAREWLAPDGHLLVEVAPRQASAAAELFLRGGLSSRVSGSDELEVAVVVGTAA